MTKSWLQRIPSQEQALMKGQYDYFLKLNNNLVDRAWKDEPLAIRIDQLPITLKQQLVEYAQRHQIGSKQVVIRPSILREILSEK